MTEKNTASIRTTQILIASFAFLFLSACQEEMSPIKEMSPLIAGSVFYEAKDKAWFEKSLTQPQLQALTKWLTRGSSNWEHCYITPPSITLRVTLKHADGSSSTLSQLNFTNTQNTLMANHLSGSNLSDQPCAFQSFSQDDISALRAILKVPQ